jgi:hypothetical protein
MTGQIQIDDDVEALMKEFEAHEAGILPEGQSADAANFDDGLDDNADQQGQEGNVEQGTQGKETGQSQDGQGLDEANADGVATRDGKHIIPYSVLKTERERAARADQLLQDANQRIAELQSQLAGNGSKGANTGEGARTATGEPAETTDDIPADDLAALKEDFPTVYAALMKANERTQALEAKLKPVEETVRTQEQNQARSAAEQVQEAIDSVPKLAHIQSTDPNAFAQAKKFDAMLREDPTWEGKPLTERFAKVVELMEAARGPINIPGRTTAPSSTQTTESIKQAARTKAASASAAHVPTSLSDFPAGQPAASDELQAIEQMTPQALAAKFASMDPDQMDAYFQSL